LVVKKMEINEINEKYQLLKNKMAEIWGLL
jgi:hypothetical protein